MTVTADGSCLFSAISIGMIGNQDLAVELRFRTGIEMVKNEQYYRNVNVDHLFQHMTPSFTNAVKDCLSKSGYSSVFTIMALATVI